ncbi:O-antigen ligase family protein [Sphaerimonospora cavernae]|uniref:O-antigen ligase family protein n=1 Tax=Sphaerimonospora cavernae TaxID=1740611 RepID=A0ABV6U6S7_9ACTN
MMTTLAAGLATSSVTRGRMRADGASLAVLFALSLLLVPARLVLRGLPLSLTPADILSLLAGMSWVCATFTTTLGAAKGRTPVRTALFVYMTAMLATYGVASYGFLPADELKLADHALVLVMAGVGLALAVCDGVRGADRLDLVLKTVVVGGALISIIAAFQFVIDLDLTRYLVLPGLRYASEGGIVEARDSLRRVAATTGHPIEFGVLCSMLLPLAAHYGFQARERGEPALRWWLCTALIGMGLMFSVSRSAVLGVVVVSVILFSGWPGRRRVRALIVAAVFLALMKVLVPGLLGTIYGLFANFGTDNSVLYRTHDYAVAASEIAKHPWLGRGVGTWYAPKYQVFDNQYILTTVETGLIGVTAFAGVLLTGAYSGLRARYLSRDPGRRDLGLTLAACLIVPLVGSATFDLLSFATVTGVSFLLIGAAGSLLRMAVEERHGPEPPARPGEAPSGSSADHDA